MDGETLQNSISNMMHFVPRSKTTRRQKQRDIEEMAQAGKLGLKKFNEDRNEKTYISQLTPDSNLLNIKLLNVVLVSPGSHLPI